MDRQHYLYRVHRDGLDRYLIWYANDQDGFLLRSDGSAQCFESPESAKSFAEQARLDVIHNPADTLDVDQIQNWVDAATPARRMSRSHSPRICLTLAITSGVAG